MITLGQKEKPLPVRAFLGAVRHWLRSVDACDVKDAIFHAKQLKQIGKLLAYDPEFKKIFLENKDHCFDEEPEHVINCVYAYLHAVTDAACSGRYRQPICPDAPRGDEPRHDPPQRGLSKRVNDL